NITYSIVSGGATINSSTGEVSNVTADFVVRATATGANGCGTETVDIAVTVGQINVATVQTHLTGSGYSLADGDFLWTGKLGSDWDDINNWLKYSQAQNEFVAVTAPPLPTENIFVLNVTTTCYGTAIPIVPDDATPRTARTVFIGTGAAIDLRGTLDVYGDWKNNGSLFIPSGIRIVNFTGTEIQNVY